jgi:hypothetical protein
MTEAASLSKGTILITPIAKALPYIICGGIGVGIGIDVAHTIDPEHFPIHILGNDGLLEGLIPQTPPIEIEGYSSEAPGVQILDMNGDGKAMTPEEYDYLGTVMERLGYPPGHTTVVVLNPYLIHEVDLAIKHIHEGADMQVVYDTLSPSGKFAFNTVYEGLSEGKDVVMSDKGGTTIRPVQRVELIDGPGTRH